ncbi:MAG: polysaccharide biosynthesis/export family protein [Pirellulaceae bacterium]|nr:polysaccharide biosynthesis/export family protein [Pirellulaceae bacterium]
MLCSRVMVIPLLTILLGFNTGCHLMYKHAPVVEAPDVCPDDTPRELYKAALPEYRIEPPDILAIDAVRLLPGPDYKLHIQDVLTVTVFVSAETPLFNVDPAEFVVGIDGTIDLGPTYGPVPVAGLSVAEARAAVERAVSQQVRTAQVSLRVSALPTLQPIAGEHLVGPDGMINLGSYGSVSVVGKTVNEARQTIERHLSQFLTDPQVSVNVFAFNSKKYYVITEGAGLGDTVTMFPITGNETVLDAIANVNGLDNVSSKKIWVARPTSDSTKVQILPVDWRAITAQASTGTNYQLMPGDRIFVKEDSLIAFDNNLGKLLAPFERVMGFSMLGVGTVTRFSGSVLKGGGNPWNAGRN